ncbi:MAG: S8 family serine peptidase [Pseudomonadota bacterium]
MDMKTVRRDDKGPKDHEGRENYDPYPHLWHLFALNVLSGDGFSAEDAHIKITGSVWERTDGQGATIALIDTGVDYRHPNLLPDGDGKSNKIDLENAVDFATHPFGAMRIIRDRKEKGGRGKRNESKKQEVGGEDEEDSNPHLGGEQDAECCILRPEDWDNLKAHLADIDAEPGVVACAQALSIGTGVQRDVRDYLDLYSGHGTACAGLAVADTKVPAGTTHAISDETGSGPITYFGVAPGAKLLPINTSIDADPKQLVMALIYALSQRVDVILMPRTASDPIAAYPETPDDFAWPESREERSDESRAAWRLFRETLLWVSRQIPVICGSGNGSLQRLSYPAHLAAIGENGIVAVGALSYKARRSGYSSYGQGLTLVAPSDDGEVLNRHEMRLDEQDPAFLHHNFRTVWGEPNPGIREVVDYSPQSILTIDVAGPRGYEPGSQQSERDGALIDLDRAAMYTTFGGTSAAAAMVAGAVALYAALEKQLEDACATSQYATGDGPDAANSKDAPDLTRGAAIKRKLRRACVTSFHWPWAAEELRLTPDPVNGPSDDYMGSQFGSGLLDVSRFLDSVGQPATGEEMGVSKGPAR